MQRVELAFMTASTTDRAGSPASRGWGWIEKNMTILARLAVAERPAGKLRVADLGALTRGFAARLEDPVRACQAAGSTVVLIQAGTRVRPDERGLERLRAAMTSVL